MERIIQVIDIEKYYGYAECLTKAIDRISFNVDEGEFLCIMGKSGSGKTTLLNVMSTIDEVTAGHIFFAGKDISKISEDERADFRKNNIGFIFQGYNLIDSFTIKENVCMPLIMNGYDKRKIEKQSDEVLKQLDILDIQNKYPYQVSGGQQQRCACARALICNSKYLFADEPTGALDAEASVRLMGIFRMLCDKFSTTIVMVSHDPIAASFCDRVLFLENGEIIYELLRGNKKNEQMLEEILRVEKL